MDGDSGEVWLYPSDETLSAIEAAFADVVPTHVLSYLQLLCEKGRMNCFIGSVDEYCALVDAAERISKASVISAVPLTDDEKENDTLFMHARTGKREISCDDTHTNLFGAVVNAYLIAEDIKKAGIPLSLFLKKE